MLSDFFGFDTVRIGTLTDGKHLAIVPSGIGLGTGLLLPRAEAARING